MLKLEKKLYLYKYMQLNIFFCKISDLMSFADYVTF